MSRSAGSAFGASPSRASRRPSPASAACATSPSAPMAASSTSQAPSGRLAEQRACGFRGQPGLSRAARPDQGGEPMLGDELADRGDISVLADEAGQLGPQVGLPVLLPLAQLAPQQRDVQRRTAPARGRRPARRPGLLWCAGTRSSASVSRPAATRARISAATSRSRTGCAATKSVSSVTSSAPWPRLVSASNRSSRAVRRSRFQPGDRRVKRCAFRQADVLHGRAAPQCERLAQQPYPPWILVVAGLAGEALEPHGVDSVGFHVQPVAVGVPLDQPAGERLPQP